MGGRVLNGKGRRVVVKPIVSRNCQSAGDAIREVFQLQLIETHFLLVSGDLVANVQLVVRLLS